MARYVQDVTLNKPDDFVAFIMNDFLQKNGFTMSDWKGEAAYRAGDAMLEGYKYLKWSYANGVFHLEAWLKGSFGREWDLNGFTAVAQKKPYKTSLEQLITILQQTIPDPNMRVGGSAAMNPDGTPAPTVIPVRTIDNQTAATLALVFGILSIVFSVLWAILGIIFAVLGSTQARMGQGSSKAGFAKAGKICSIVGFSLSIIFWILSVILSVAGSAL